MLVSIVIPCYNSEHSIKKTVELTVEEFKKLPGYEYRKLEKDKSSNLWCLMEEEMERGEK